jgi:hypothetical protein
MKRTKVTINDFTPTTFQIASEIRAGGFSKSIETEVNHTKGIVLYKVYKNTQLIGVDEKLQPALDYYNDIF